MSAASGLSSLEIQAALLDCGMSISNQQAEQLTVYLDLLMRWNARTNLTAIRDPLTIVQRHFADSLFCASHIPLEARLVLDFGSGGGFPGIPAAIMRPDLSMTLAESQSKKSAFLREAVRAVAIEAEVWSHRVELMPTERQFDCITLRAVDQMISACATAASRLAEDGTLLAFSTERLRETVEHTLPTWHWGSVTLPHTEQGLLLKASR